MIRRNVLVWLVAAAVPMSNALAADGEICPTLPTANARLQARAAYLVEQWNDEQRAAAGADVAEEAREAAQAAMIGVSGLDLAVALFKVVEARAREEARLWLLTQIETQICTGTVTVTRPDGTAARRAPITPYFPNTCAVLTSSSDYPGASLTLIQTGLRRDLYALPACHEYLQDTPPGSGL